VYIISTYLRKYQIEAITKAINDPDFVSRDFEEILLDELIYPRDVSE